jgi:DNA-binding transcriptional LysR family regulator
VAEELSFTRAASRLHVAQPPLGAGVRKLEQELGVRLFERSSRRVTLTAAGRLLLPKARVAIRAAEEAYAAAVQASQGLAGEIRIGVSFAVHATAAPILRELTDRHADIEPVVRHDTTEPLVDDLRLGRLDVVIGFAVQPVPGLHRDLLRLDRAVVAVHARNRYAGRDVLRLEDLRDDTFAIAPAGVASGYNQAVVGFCLEAGFSPKVAVSEGYLGPRGFAPDVCVGITTRLALAAIPIEFEPVVVELSPAHAFAVELLWRSDRTSALIETFRSVATTVVTRERWLPPSRRSAADDH